MYIHEVVCSSVMIEVIYSCFCPFHPSMLSTRGRSFEFQVYVGNKGCILLRTYASSSEMEKSAMANVMKAHHNQCNWIFR